MLCVKMFFILGWLEIKWDKSFEWYLVASQYCLAASILTIFRWTLACLVIWWRSFPETQIFFVFFSLRIYFFPHCSFEIFLENTWNSCCTHLPGPFITMGESVNIWLSTYCVPERLVLVPDGIWVGKRESTNIWALFLHIFSKQTTSQPRRNAIAK